MHLLQVYLINSSFGTSNAKYVASSFVDCKDGILSQHLEMKSAMKLFKLQVLVHVS